MNKQLIVELRRQAGDLGSKEIRIYDLSRDQMLDIFMEKFAEAIVKECVSVVSKRKNQAIDDGWNVDEAMTTAEMDIKEHFGVEE